MGTYRLTPEARTGLLGILDYVERTFGARVAERVLDELVAAFERLAENPRIGRVRADLTSDDRVRFWSVPPTLVAYRSVHGVAEILFVERGERDWAKLFEEQGGGD